MLHPEGDVSNARFQTRDGAANRRRSWRLGCRQDKGDARPLSERAYRASVLDRAATRPDGDTDKDRETVRSMETWLACRQRRLGVVGLVCLLVITSLVTPLSLDMYTPAIPHMTDYFDADAGTVNLTLCLLYTSRCV